MTVPAGLLRRCLAAVLIGLAAYFSFWSVATLLELKARPPQVGTRAAITFTPLDSAGRPIADLGQQVAEYQKPYRYVSRLPDLRASAARVLLHFDHAAAPGPELGLMLIKRVDLLAVRLNGHVITPEQRTLRLSGSFVSEPALFYLPPENLVAGRNTIEVVVRRSLRDPFLIPDYAIAPAAELSPYFNFRSAMIVDASIIGLALMLLIVLLCVVVNWPNPEKAKMRAFIAALTCSICLGSMFLFSNVERVTFTPYAIFHSLFSLTLGASILFYAFKDSAATPGSIGRYMAISAGLILTLAAVLTCIYYTGRPERFLLHGFSILGMLFAAFSLILAAILLIWRSTAHGWPYLAERFVLIIWFGAVAFDRGEAGVFTMSSPFVPGMPLSLHWLPIMGTIVGLAMLVVLARQAGDAREVVYSANEQLAARLAEREAELSTTYRERAHLLARHATEEERQRIMRDMHDGLGSQLMSMLLAARRGEVQPVSMAEGLQAVIDEMRLMIDSMDSVGESLGSAFAIFRERIASRVEAAGFAFIWDDGFAGPLPHYGPRDVLQAFRVMQEAVTNALKHSGAATLTVRIAPAPDPAMALRITIADDGRGMTGTNPRGKGMSSMAARAASIGGQLHIASSERGVTVTLDLPETDQTAMA